MPRSQPAKKRRKDRLKRKHARQHTTGSRRAMYAVAVIAVIGATILVAAGLLTRSTSPRSDRQDASATTRAAPRPLQATGKIVSRATRSWEDIVAARKKKMGAAGKRGATVWRLRPATMRHTDD